MTTLYLVRHGENDYVKKGKLAGRLPGIHLNDKGRAQAAALAAWFKEKPVKAVYASPLERTLETAAPIAAALGLKIIERPGLLEMEIGDWTDKSLKRLALRKDWRIVQRHPSRFQFPNGETFAGAQARIAAEIESLAARYKNPKHAIVCVFHSDPIKLALSHFLGQPLDLFQRIIVAPGSVSAIHLGPGGGAAVSAVNFVPPPVPDA
ncbi:MAG: histidine phosphatase family protein [Chloroflexi bacterium]|nr:histidine phosphatase family protein [Chloroflexota bacterium]